MNDDDDDEGGYRHQRKRKRNRGSIQLLEEDEDEDMLGIEHEDDVENEVPWTLLDAIKSKFSLHSLIMSSNPAHCATKLRLQPSEAQSLAVMQREADISFGWFINPSADPCRCLKSTVGCQACIASGGEEKEDSDSQEEDSDDDSD